MRLCVEKFLTDLCAGYTQFVHSLTKNNDIVCSKNKHKKKTVLVVSKINLK
jgi:hypothetical protein